MSLVKPATNPQTEPLLEVDPELLADLHASHEEASRGEYVSTDEVLDDVRRIARGEALTP